MRLMSGLLSKWPLVRQIRERKDGTGLEAMSEKTRAMHARTDGAKVARSICPYCGVGCGQLIYHDGKKIISIEGDPESPISQGNLCPERRGFLSTAHPFTARNQSEISRASLEKLDGNSARSSDGHGGRSRLGIAETHLYSQARRLDDQSHYRDLPPRRRDAG